ncbi:MAG: hypothetical protein JZU49_06210 [Sulfuricurvum sp.]|nr:hypothetical protein [Sulfuricurvum sp.]
MIRKFRKYKNLSKLISHEPISKTDFEYSLVFHNCGGFDLNNEKPRFNELCFGCLFCVNDDSQKSFYEYATKAELQIISSSMFKGEIVRTFQAKRIVKNPYKNLEIFTRINETKNIQPWVAGLLDQFCSPKTEISMEVNSPNLSFDRDGRIDICSISKSVLLAIETKTCLDDAMNDERFVDQHAKYSSVIEAEVSSKNYKLIILLGGKETDLLFSDHLLCSSNIGNKSKKFYKLISEKNIHFVSANAFWGLALAKMLNENEKPIDETLNDIFNDKECIGLLTCGKIIEDKGIYSIKNI